VFVLVILLLPQGIYPAIRDRVRSGEQSAGLHPIVAALRGARFRIPTAGGR
jgi:hypothetical protein